MECIDADVAIIGAGPAGIASTLRLLRSTRRQRIVLIDAGRPFRKRYCPVDHYGICNGCKGTCNVICGFGGSIHYGDAVKLSQFPSGLQLQRVLGADAESDMDQALVGLFGGAKFLNAEHGNGAVDSDKDYPVAVLSAQQVRDAVERWWRAIANDARVDMRLGTRAERIEPGPAGFEVRCVSLAGQRRLIRAGKVFVGVGRKGIEWWREEVRRLGLAFSEPVASLGLRFECPARFLAKAAGSHADLKLQHMHNGKKFKTFCLCASPRRGGGGRIKFTDYGAFTLLDGHVDPEVTETVGGTANFAVLVQLADAAGRPVPYEAIKEQYIRPYMKLRSDRPGKPVVQWYPDFERCGLRCRDLASLQRRSRTRLTARDYAIANIAGILPPDIHEGFVQAVEAFGQRMQWLDARWPKRSLHRVNVIGLELEKMWDVLHVSSSMMTSINGLHAIGDCAGVAQGILQAAASGFAAARSIGAE